MVFQVTVGSEDHKRYKGTFPRLARSSKYNQDMIKHVLEEDKSVVDDNANHQGARMVFLTMNSTDTWKKPKC